MNVASANGSHVLRNPRVSTYFPFKNIQKHKITMFHELRPLNGNCVKHSATYEWQLSRIHVGTRANP
ncbi:hypothetical protein F441_08424 [Phytophthora nicotianae CJ01A1]|uniref:Uncharacterized protein n=3 Tax=Phytophthora nicotianae TaxID=4792 RepID=W2GW63_PHYNI|nr:hypothetical protein L915_08275 [Phytophthora nicotianae]ETO76043.1 hypothetical protein F444_08502 [Phytophthora nicotianae P1976]ETP17131.1 hypothetical protein F441_08424 [Phytophthora nicotianae CJ01A1]ETL40701.1 hypothetical protein L916_08199 [Phytophthora nicotianae]ETL93841.1 hypothetical protein L917_08100 [Phytophthora nicotianae]